MTLLQATVAGAWAALDGAKEMVRRFGIERLADAVAKVEYRGLDLSHLYASRPANGVPR